MKKHWWQEAIFYQIYVRSYKDSNGDGIGDLNGIRSALPYLSDLGITALYLNPIFKSPNDDYGYDVSDYYTIQPEYGSLADFQNLLKEVHDLGMRLILDLPINHTSDEHPWFLQAKQDKQDPHHAYYLWRQEPNNWPSFFGGSGWAYNELTDEYYLHIFSAKQPDLNFNNPALRQEILAIMKYWQAQGVDGFRMDAINHLAKDTNFPDGVVQPGSSFGDFIPYVQNRPQVHDYIKEMRQAVGSEFLLAGEAGGIGFETAHEYTAPHRQELDFLFHFDMHSPRHGGKDWLEKPLKVRSIKRSFQGWANRPAEAGWQVSFYSNHDTSRTLSRIGNDREHALPSAKALALLQLTQKGTPFIYYGDEIGMTRAANFKLVDYRDLTVTNRYREEVLTGQIEESDFLKGLYLMNRDHSRTPMQWNKQPQAGFTTGSPWIPVNENYREINTLTRKPLIEFYKELIVLRKKHPCLTFGQQPEILSDHPQVYAYYRQDEEELFLIVLNLTDEPAKIPEACLRGQLLLSTTETPPQKEGDHYLLSPWQACLFQIR